MPNNSWPDAADRVAFLRQGVVVVEADPAGRRLEITGAPDDRVIAVVCGRLGDAVDVEVIGALPRMLAPRPCVGHMEREAGRLQVRFRLCGDEHVDDIVVAEDDRTVVVLATVCTPMVGAAGEWYEVPCHVYLERPLGGRAVVDGVSGRPIPYKNVWADIADER